MAGHTIERSAASASPSSLVARLGLQPGEWMSAPKLTVKAMMRPNWALKVRIWACLMLQSFGYNTDLAMVMSKGKYGNSPNKSVQPITPQGIIGLLNKATFEAFKESGIPIDEETKKRLKIPRQDMRRALADLEENAGLIARVRINCVPTALDGLTMAKAVEKGMITPLAILTLDQRRKLQTGNIGICLLPKPRPAKVLDVGKVAYMGGPQVPDSLQNPEEKAAIQLVFDFFPEYKTDPKRAAEIVRHRVIKKAFAAYELKCAQAKNLEKEAHSIEKAAREEFAQAVRIVTDKPARSDDQAKLFAPPIDLGTFHAELCLRFQRAGKPVPTKNQAKPLLARLNGRAHEFTSTLTLSKLKRVQHPGILPSLVQEFLDTPVEEAPAVEAPAVVCKRCGNSGLLGVEWQTLPEAVEAVNAGALYCECEEGALTRDFVEPERLRLAARVGRAS